MAESRQACRDWPHGNCPRGIRCPFEHHANLDASLVGTGTNGYMVSNIAGEACWNCLQMGRSCDKRGRGGDDDPCSECRWFGGKACKCKLMDQSSYNDQMFAAMLERRAWDYALAPPKDRTTPRGKGPLKSPPTPMPDDQVKPGWRGQSREQVLAKPEMIPSFVRERPRAYLVSPRPSVRARKSAEHRGLQLGGPSQVSSSAAPQAPSPATFPADEFPPPFPYPPPQAHPRYGSVLSITWMYATRTWERQYADGTKLKSPPLPEPVRHIRPV
ncbi:hypothetical protein ANO11243_001080 [Dothideomycetidae sp. 11243]|nr:hypothetical protein ANO11243_001080 [fungal sp. No.11243]